MLQPKRVKYRKMHRGRRQGMANSGNTLAFGEFGIQALEPASITGRQLEAARRAMSRQMRRGGQIWIRVFPQKSVTKKPPETRMGSGKGNPEFWVTVVKPGHMLFEVAGVPEADAKAAMRLAQDKLPIRTQLVTREVE
ncbi:MAG: 50S ribosomal protein L16 [Chloroflexi bacterium]|nr:50S ribosomal protein L16 [Chloroflexota bacterium]